MRREVNISTARRSGRPKKSEHQKVKYQRIAVRMQDYERFVAKLEKRDEQMIVAFGQMVDSYPEQ